MAAISAYGDNVIISTVSEEETSANPFHYVDPNEVTGEGVGTITSYGEGVTSEQLIAGDKVIYDVNRVLYKNDKMVIVPVDAILAILTTI